MTRVRIDRLVLDGVPPDQRGAVVAALRAELARQLAAPPAGGPRAPVPQLAPASPGEAGRLTARAVARAIGSVR